MGDSENPYATPKGDPSREVDRREIHFLQPGGKGRAIANGAASVLKSVFTILGALFVLGYLFSMFARGRQVRRRGRVLLPGITTGGAWAGPPVAIRSASSAPAGLAPAWRENARTEHASVAAFARLVLDLVALGAPPELIAAANLDALDEIRHAELCFAIARSFGGAGEGPAPFPEVRRLEPLPRMRTAALAKLAVESLVDGALHEGVSARVIGAVARRSEDASLRDVLEAIAADEARHAAHGWDVVEWCAAEGGARVAQVLAGAIRAVPRELASSRQPEARDGAWERWGIPGSELERNAYAELRARLAARVTRLCDAGSASHRATLPLSGLAGRPASA